MLLLSEEDRIRNPGLATKPMQTPWRVGTDTDFIAFDFLPREGGQVVLHSALQSALLAVKEDFLYEMWDRHEAAEAARSMVDDAIAYLSEQGVYCQRNTTDGFINRLDAFIFSTLN